MPITTDRRHMWRLAGFLCVWGTTPAHHKTATSLHTYLKTTCQHFWEPIPPDYYAHHTPGAPVTVLQCRYCAHVRDRHPAPESGWDHPTAGDPTTGGAGGGS